MMTARIARFGHAEKANFLNLLPPKDFLLRLKWHVGGTF
jgi:hypothetical protein